MKRDQVEHDPARFFADLSRRLTTPQEDPEPTHGREEDDPLVHELVRSFLMWNAPRQGVPAALAKLREAVTDYNELRVCFCDEIAAMLGPRYPLAHDRCLRLRAALREVFLRENALALVHLRDESKRAARAYLDSLPGMTPFVAARLCLVGLEAHAFPVDAQLLPLLEAGEAVEPGLTPDAAAAKLERAIRAGEALGCYRLLEKLALESPAGGGAGRKTRTAKAGASPRRAGRA